MIIAFDVDGTLIDLNDKPRRNILDMLKFLSSNNKIIVWSGGGKLYAEMIVRRLGLEKYIFSCCSKIGNDFIPDIAFDDELVNLGKVNIKV